jgi:hypothetical protein
MWCRPSTRKPTTHARQRARRGWQKRNGAGVGGSWIWTKPATCNGAADHPTPTTRSPRSWSRGPRSSWEPRGRTCAAPWLPDHVSRVMTMARGTVDDDAPRQSARCAVRQVPWHPHHASHGAGPGRAAASILVGAGRPAEGGGVQHLHRAMGNGDPQTRTRHRSAISVGGAQDPGGRKSNQRRATPCTRHPQIATPDA